MRFKLSTITLLVFFFFLITPGTAEACEIEFKVVKGKKEMYQTGDTLVVKVKVVLTHRACPIAMQKTKFKMKNLKVIKSTPWKELDVMNWERQLMIVVKDTQEGKLILTAIRECDKDGGFGSMKLEAVPN